MKVIIKGDLKNINRRVSVFLMFIVATAVASWLMSQVLEHFGIDYHEGLGLMMLTAPALLCGFLGALAEHIWVKRHEDGDHWGDAPYMSSGLSTTGEKNPYLESEAYLASQVAATQGDTVYLRSQTAANIPQYKAPILLHQLRESNRTACMYCDKPTNEWGPEEECPIRRAYYECSISGLGPNWPATS